MSDELRPSVVREVNERIAEITRIWEWEDKQSFLCECAAGGCTTAVWLTRMQYEAIRGESTFFFALAGHERAGDEHVVERNDGYVVIARLNGIARRPASAAAKAARRPNL